jgi:outer membrane beta-barrel protein
MGRRWVLSTVVLAVCVIASRAGAAEGTAPDKSDKTEKARSEKAKDSEAKPTRPSEAAPPKSCLDESISDELGDSLRPRGVQRLPFLKDHRFELIARGGLYASDLLSSSYQYGGGLAWWLSEDFGFEATFDVSPVAVDLDDPLAKDFGHKFKKGTGYLLTANMLWAPMHFKAKTAGGSLLHGDAMFVFGFGKMFNDTAQGLAADGGLIVELYATRWLSFRFDLRDVVLVQEAVSETRITNNVQGTLGLAIWLPFWFS